LPLLLELTQISKAFAGVKALKEVSFDLKAGEVHALVGENGAGKSTLIKVITGAHAPDEGTIAIQGQQIDQNDPVRARALGIAAIYQQPALFPDLTVAENIALGLDTGGPWRIVRWNQSRRRARQLLERIGASIDPQAIVRSLSMPEQQLVEIARAIGASARILIMDEPTASLTDKEVDRLFRVIADLKAQDVGIIYISHRLEELPLVAGKVVLSVQGLGCRESRVHDVDLEVRAGEIVGLAGLIGAGRSELARILFGLTPADSGEIHFQGRRVTIESPAQAVELGIAYVPEDRRHHGVILEMSVAANMTLATLRSHSRLGLLDRASECATAQDFVNRLGVKTPSLEAPVANLSGGNQQKVALARWLAASPTLLILDEPTQGVDVGAKAEIHRLMSDLAKQGLAILMISSELPEILGMSDRIAVMCAGTIVAHFDRSAATQEAILEHALGHLHSDHCEVTA
jgi:rhamnose transport system ATP-binding protein